ncbi:Hypothetical protein, putative [Bodo saltans]|uniref:Membrane-associated protein n=1 Tax=Bodo saltans TaxID=75058 RepID=A0A0S4JA12_BODSA|nr:Hypothetical protein, putative [Bodo saltans]|eukprot:CUG88324.1 Hypothetical protein, putative [Bodo saltans]
MMPQDAFPFRVFSFVVVVVAFAAPEPNKDFRSQPKKAVGMSAPEQARSRKRSRSPITAPTTSAVHVCPPPSTSTSSLLSPAELWTSLDKHVWAQYLPGSGIRFRQALEAFRGAMKRPSVDVLFEVDAKSTPFFFSEHFATHITAQEPQAAASATSAATAESLPQLQSEVYAKVVLLMNRKLSRGQFRPGLLQQVQTNTPAAVHAAVSASYMLAHSEMVKAVTLKTQQNAETLTPKGAAALCLKILKPLVTLKGVGPATASLIASRFVLPSLYHHHHHHSTSSSSATFTVHGVWPFMSDEAASVVLGVPTAKLKYTTGELASFVETLWGKVDNINKQEDTTTAYLVTPDALCHALWAAKVLSISSQSAKK